MLSFVVSEFDYILAILMHILRIDIWNDQFLSYTVPSSCYPHFAFKKESNHE